jgi:hypothetical protein
MWTILPKGSATEPRFSISAFQLSAFQLSTFSDRFTTKTPRHKGRSLFNLSFSEQLGLVFGGWESGAAKS